MRIIARWALNLSVSVAVAGAAAQQKHKTEAQTDGFEGPIRSVSTSVEMTKVWFRQPNGPALVMPVGCQNREYDPDGNLTRCGRNSPDGGFDGEEIALVRDGQGHVIERSRIGTDGKVFEQEKDGPFGPVEQFYSTGPTKRSTRTYDRLGNLSECLSFDAVGRRVSRSTIRTNPDGQWTERATWGKDGQLTYRETYDPETDFQHFEAHDESGAVKVTFTFSHDRVQSFWAASEDPNQFGSSFTNDKGNGNFDRFLCHKDGDCEVSHVRYAYADSTKRNPTSAEWRNSEGTVLYAAYYEYEFDGEHNWTKRTVWVRSPELSERTLYETDTRAITYWAN